MFYYFGMSTAHKNAWGESSGEGQGDVEMINWETLEQLD